MSDKRQIVVLHSGGLDSTVCLLLALKQGLEPTSVGIDYGQRHRVELDYAKRQCERLGVARKVIRVRWNKPARQMPTNRSVEEMRAGISPAFLPGRNAVFLTLAFAEAAGLGASEVWIGVNSVDFSGYPDCTAAFILAFQTMINTAIPGAPQLVAPLQELSKKQIGRLARDCGLGPQETWSCYQPVKRETTCLPCGSCDACILHEYAWRTD